MNFKRFVLIFFGITVSWLIGSITPSNAQDNVQDLCTVIVGSTDDDDLLTASDKVRTNHLCQMDDHEPLPTPTPITPIPIPERIYFIHFDTDKSRPNRTQMAAVAEVAKAIRQLHDRQNVTLRSIRIEGHADTVATNAYNLKLSRERAETVDLLLRRALGARLYNTYESTVDYFGETQLAVPTANEIDEPANRRVEIKLQIDDLEFSR